MSQVTLAAREGKAERKTLLCRCVVFVDGREKSFCLHWLSFLGKRDVCGVVQMAVDSVSQVYTCLCLLQSIFALCDLHMFYSTCFLSGVIDTLRLRQIG